MPDISSPDQVAGYLAEVRQLVGARDELVIRMGSAAVDVVVFNAAQDRLAERVPRLLAAVEAALIRHQGSVDYDYPQEGRFCAPCGEWWPCREYQDITRALLGEES